MRLSFLALALIFILSGCIRQTLTEIPHFAGTVVDSNTGQPLAGVKIDKQIVTTGNGQFAFPAVDKKIWSFPMPGAGQRISRSLTFSKTGYQTVTCEATNLSLFAEPNIAIIPLVKLEESEVSDNYKFYFPLKDNELNIYCRIFIGSRVEYQQKNYIIGNIFQDDDNDQPSLILWPALPNSGDEIILVEQYYPHQVEISHYPRD